MHGPTGSSDQPAPTALNRLDGLSAQIAKKLRSGRHAADKQAIPRPRASDVEELALSVGDIVQFYLVGDRRDAFGQRQDFVVASHDRDCFELEALGKMHDANRDALAAVVVPFGKLKRLLGGIMNSCPGTGKLFAGASSSSCRNRFILRGIRRASFFRQA
jgi:hypothetical protein